MGGWLKSFCSVQPYCRYRELSTRRQPSANNQISVSGSGLHFNGNYKMPNKTQLNWENKRLELFQGQVYECRGNEPNTRDRTNSQNFSVNHSISSQTNQKGASMFKILEFFFKIKGVSSCFSHKMTLLWPQSAPYLDSHNQAYINYFNEVTEKQLFRLWTYQNIFETDFNVTAGATDVIRLS